ncbi:MAG: acyltransferase, partial [Clostridia bacterium]|nr:acyltransferase [Clostridia bacterium]
LMFPNTYSPEAYTAYLRRKGVYVGKNTKIFSPNQTIIDVQRPEMLHIGDYCKITSGVKILCHDYSMSVARRKYHVHCGSAAETYIGDNVFIGVNAVILMGSHIGNNSIVGAGAVVSGQFPDDVVIAGNPARVICTIEEYYKKHTDKQYESAKLYFKKLHEAHGKIPTVKDMGNAFAWLYLPRTKETIEEYSALFKLSGDDQVEVINDFLASKGMFESYEEFVESILGKSK